MRSSLSVCMMPLRLEQSHMPVSQSDSDTLLPLLPPQQNRGYWTPHPAPLPPLFPPLPYRYPKLYPRPPPIWSLLLAGTIQLDPFDKKRRVSAEQPQPTAAHHTITTAHRHGPDNNCSSALVRSRSTIRKMHSLYSSTIVDWNYYWFSYWNYYWFSYSSLLN